MIEGWELGSEEGDGGSQGRMKEKGLLQLAELRDALLYGKRFGNYGDCSEGALGTTPSFVVCHNRASHMAEYGVGMKHL